MSRIGNRAITLPGNVKCSVADDGQVVIEGPKGKLAWRVPTQIGVRVEDGRISLARRVEERKARALHGLSRALLANMVEGVLKGYSRSLEIHGVGFRAAVQGPTLTLSLGFSHPVNFPIPDDVKVTVRDNTKLTIEGIDKCRVGQVAADIRAYYPPEPYKGKGIRYADEHVRRKEGKKVQ
jgi:large subunit ribosomal protein L6